MLSVAGAILAKRPSIGSGNRMIKDFSHLAPLGQALAGLNFGNSFSGASAQAAQIAQFMNRPGVNQLGSMMERSSFMDVAKALQRSRPAYLDALDQISSKTAFLQSFLPKSDLSRLDSLAHIQKLIGQRSNRDPVSSLLRGIQGPSASGWAAATAARRSVDIGEMMRELLGKHPSWEPTLAEADDGAPAELSTSAVVSEWLDLVSTQDDPEDESPENAQSTIESLLASDEFDQQKIGRDAALIADAIEALPPVPWSASSPKKSELKNDILFYIQILSLVLNLLLALQLQMDKRDQAAQQTASAQRHDESMAVQKSIAQSMDKIAERLSPTINGAIVGTQGLRVRSSPGSGFVVDIVYPNQLVAVTGKHSRWLKVTYRNHVDEREVEGWILKQYVKTKDASAESASSSN